MILENILEYIITNKKWIFSGIGVLFISLIFSQISHFISASKEYTVCEHVSRNGEYRAFKEGWSWPAFLFNFIWVLYSRLNEFISIYISTIVLLYLHFKIIDFIFSTNTIEIYHIFLSFLILTTPFILGKFGNILLKRKHCHLFNLLSRDHYIPKKTIIASNENAAIAIYLNNHIKDELNAI